MLLWRARGGYSGAGPRTMRTEERVVTRPSSLPRPQHEQLTLRCGELVVVLERRGEWLWGSGFLVKHKGGLVLITKYSCDKTQNKTTRVLHCNLFLLTDWAVSFNSPAPCFVILGGATAARGTRGT